MKLRNIAKFPIFVLIGIILMIVAFFVGGKDLFLKTAIRYLLGLFLSIILVIIFSKVKKGSAKRR
jgi:FtsH-binding integral membrane protein